jgi:cytochrome P450
MTTSSRPQIEFDHHSPEFGIDQAERFAELRGRCPMGFTEEHGGYWVASTFELAKRVMGETENFTVELNEDRTEGGKLIPTAQHAPVIVPGILDGEEHDRLRNPLRAIFARKSIEERAGPVAERVAAELADELVGREEFDFANEFSFRLTVGTIFEFVGLTEIEDRRKFILMLEDAFAIDPEAGADRTELASSTSSQYEEAENRVRDIVRSRSESPTGDLISLMVAPDTGLSVDDVTALTLSILLGGVRTTAASLDNIVVHLDQHRDLRERLIENPSEIPDAVYEMVRIYSVTPLVARTATRDIEIGDVTVHKGDRIAALIASANLDEDKFPDAGTADPDRHAGLNLAFGIGMHYCLGIWLAKMELRVAVETILARMPDYAVVAEGTQRYAKVGVNNGFSRLTVRPGG